MNICTKQLESWLNRHPKIKQWLWFAGLWLAGLATVVIFSYPIKWLMKSL